MGLISTTALAAHQIALQVAAILFMVPFGIGMAATVRVGHAVGRRDAAGVRRAGLVATVLGIGFMCRDDTGRDPWRFAIARIFLGEGPTARDATIAHRDAAAGRRDVLYRRRHPDHRMPDRSAA